jgi:hypothetical protein
MASQLWCLTLLVSGDARLGLPCMAIADVLLKALATGVLRGYGRLTWDVSRCFKSGILDHYVHNRARHHSAYSCVEHGAMRALHDTGPGKPAAWTLQDARRPAWMRLAARNRPAAGCAARGPHGTRPAALHRPLAPPLLASSLRATQGR